jgi:Tfp pilus assembly protein PilF
MSRRDRLEGNAMFVIRRRIAACVCLGAALLLPGCATTSKREEAEHNARRATSHMNLGADHLANGRGALALREFLNAASLDPRNPQIQYGLAEAYLAQQKPTEAEQHFLAALAMHAEHHDARLSLSALYIVQKRYEESIAACQVLIDDPTFVAPWRALANRGWSEYQLGRSSDARASLDLALEYSPTYWPAMLSLAVLEADAGRRLEAIGLLQEVIELGPGPRVEAEVNYRLAENYIALGKRSKALTYLTTAVAQAPDDVWARKSQEYLRLLR